MPKPGEKGSVFGSVLQFAKKLGGGRKGTIDEIARTRGLNKVFQDEQGNLFDASGKPIESKPGLVFVASAEDKGTE